MTRVGDYELEVQIGAGASGTVWRARRPGPVDQVVALKRLRAAGDPQDLLRIRREATVLATLDHPHIVRVLEVLDDADGGLAVAMQFAPGGSLAALLAERGRLAPGEVVAVAAPIADALASAHRRGILHGDVKPANVLFTSDGEPLLGDFGLARTLGRLTSDHIAGTAHYLAPEVLDGGVPDARADVYALGVVCYETLVGRPPYDGPVPLAVVRAADVGAHEPLMALGVPAPVADVVEQGMARQPGHRFASADLFARALRSAVPHDEIHLPGPATDPLAAGAAGDDDASRGTRTFGPRPPRPEPKDARPRYRLPTAFFVLIVLAGALYLIRGPLRPDESDRSACPTVERPVADQETQVVEGDPEGDGCATYGVYGPGTLPDGTTAMLLDIRVDGEQLRIGIGASGDQLFVGDWDCDDADTPGLYRRAEGRVEYFNVWPEVANQRYQPAATEPAPAGMTATVARGSGDGTADDADRGPSGASCDRIVVSTAGTDDA